MLGDIAIVFLLMRVYLPVPVVRTLLRTAAAVPLVMLMQRRGLKITILAALASYILFSALVGPLLALSAIDVAVSGILLGLGRKAGLGVFVNTIWTGPVYAMLDLALPTLATVVLFRYPIKDLIESARHFLAIIFNAAGASLRFLHVPQSVLHEVQSWKAPAEDHWLLVWLGILVIYGLLTMYLVALVSEMVLQQVPEDTLERQEAA